VEQSGREKTGEPKNDVASLIGPSPGGTLGAYVAYMKSAALPAALGAGGKYAWVRQERGLLQRLPLEEASPPDAAEVDAMLDLNGIWLVNYLLPPDAVRRANCFDYVARDPSYALEGLSGNTRSKIRRGLRRFSIRLCTWAELAERGFPAHADTASRHGYRLPPPDDLKPYIDRCRGQPFFDIWGAWHGQELAAWITVVKIDDWAIIDLARSTTSALSSYPNNALFYEALRHLLQVEKRRYVTYGLSSLQVSASELSLHKFKRSMGFEAVPLERVFAAGPLLSAALNWRLSSWMLEKVTRMLPQFALLRKAAGLSRLMSGREKAPLDWADAPELDGG